MDKKLEFTRVFNATLENAWKIWTEPELVKRWWGPDRFTCPEARMDVRIGGASVVCMRAPASFGGGDSYSIWRYTVIEPMQRLEFIQNLADKDGNPMKPTVLGMPPDFPEDILTVVTFKDLGNAQTEMTVVEHADMGSMEHFARLGMEQCLDKIAMICDSK